MSKKKMTFEIALNRLEELVQKLETGETPLEESIKSFEEGKTLVRYCLDLLDKAEIKVKELEEDPSGTFELSSFQ